MQVTVLHDVAVGYGLLLGGPWVYLAMVLFVLLQYRRTQATERSAFGVKVTSPVAEWLISICYGILAGVLISFAAYLLHLVIAPIDVIWLWTLLVIFALIDVRLSCVVYGTTGLAVLQFLGRLAQEHGLPIPSWLVTLNSIHLWSLLVLTALLHLVEGILIYLSGARGASPLFIQSRRGQIVGAYLLQKFWPIPLAVMSAGGWMVPFPVVIGYSGMAVGMVPKWVGRLVAPLVIGYGLLALLLALLVHRHPALWVWVAVLSGVIHELLYLYFRRKEADAQPIFVRPNRGVKILAVLPGSPAHKMKLSPGETIVKVGGMTVNSPYDVHFAIDQNPAYVKLEVVDLLGEVRFVGTPIYEQDPHQLGVIVVPDERAREYAEIYGFSVGKWLWRWWGRKRPHLADR